MSIPSDNINICFVGGVSTGKSTALNSVFGKKLTQCHFKRTTMVPTVYIENPVDTSDSNQIYATILEKNQEIIEKTETGHKVSKDDYKELIFNVGKLDINIIENSFVNIYDIPGLNDPRTKDIYYEYLDTNFYKFNIIVFFVDIRSGLNTSDEFDILDFITNCTRNLLKLNNRKVFTLVVVNKADDMQLNVGTDEVMVTGELKEMFEHVQHVVSDEFKKREIESQLIGIIPLCALDAYLYRMVQKFGNDFVLTPEQILKIGVNENGKKFSTLKPEEQREKVYAILQDETFINTMIKLSGFSQFERILQQFLVCAKKIRIDNILYELRDLEPITRSLFVNCKLEDSVNGVREYMNIYYKIREIDLDEFHAQVKSFVSQIVEMFKISLQNISNVNSLIEFYDRFIDSIMRPFFSEYYDVTRYSVFMQSQAQSLLLKAFDKSIKDVEIVKYFDILQRIGLFTEWNIRELFTRLCENPRIEKTITSFENPSAIIQLLREVPTSVDKSKILRFLIINQLAQETSQTHLYIRYLIYRKHGDILLADYIHGIMQRPTVKMVVDGLSESDLENPAFMLDIFYLNRFS
jgi:GTP-binding protein EngB required for normal cell division